jgi:hypothetical protein
MFCITGFLRPFMVLILTYFESILLQIEAESKATWKKLLVFLKENVAIPFPVPKDDETVPNVRREATAEADTPINDEL